MMLLTLIFVMVPSISWRYSIVVPWSWHDFVQHAEYGKSVLIFEQGITACSEGQEAEDS